MDQPQITGGEVSYMERVNLGNYEHSEAKVTLTFAVPEGSPYWPILHKAQDEAKSLVRQAIGKEKADKPAPVAKAAEPKVETKIEPAQQIAVGPENLGTIATNAAEVSFDEPNPTGSATTTAVTSPTVPAETATPAADPSVIDLDTPVTREINDAELMGVVTQTQARIKNAKPIKDLILKYAPNGTSRGVPQNLREAFCNELKGLKAAA
jgi:hypothetical protein